MPFNTLDNTLLDISSPIAKYCQQLGFNSFVTRIEIPLLQLVALMLSTCVTFQTAARSLLKNIATE